MNNKKVVLFSGYPRGFLSEYMTLLTSFRVLLKHNFLAENIFIHDSMFYLYGNPINWFSQEKVSSNFENSLHYNTMDSHSVSDWTTEELSMFKTILPYGLLGEYMKYFPLNTRVQNILNKKKSITDSCLGLHYRGTDHQGATLSNTNAGSGRVSVEIFIENADKKLQTGQYNCLFLATDENRVLDKLYNTFKQKYNSLDIFYNDCIRSNSDTAIHLDINNGNKSSSLFTPEEKIKMGEEVLLDSQYLSFCSEVICRDSNIINYATVLNPKLKIHYLG